MRITSSLSIFFFIFHSFFVSANDRAELIYSSLDPTSLKQHLAFYEIYSKESKGAQALSDAWEILTGQRLQNFANQALPFFPKTASSLVALINRQAGEKIHPLTEKELTFIESFTGHLKHRSLKGHQTFDQEKIIQLTPENIDLARALFVMEMEGDQARIRTYEALLDIMALQIAARLPPQPTPKQMVEKINQLIFDEMEFRFPPHSTFKENIDAHTFLPSVLDTHQGVCLGVSIIYLCLAQRLGFKMEAVTPPGHIYVRYVDHEQVINVETTARGIHLDSKEYLSLDTHQLQTRNIKEVVGLAHFNHAAMYWQKKEYESAYQAYLKAEPYLKHDPLLKEFMGYTLLFIGREKEGREKLNEIKDYIPPHALSKSTLANDYLNGNVDMEGIKLIFSNQEKERSALLQYKNQLKEVILRHPYFRTGLAQLAMVCTKLHCYAEALQLLKKYHAIDEKEAEINYYLALLSFSRLHYPAAWDYLHQAENIVKEHHYLPQTLKELRRELLQKCPE